jgi:hypothetical protein
MTTPKNIAIGATALKYMTSGGDNIAIGTGALFNVSFSGNSNIGIGTSALSNLEPGDNNIAIGTFGSTLTTGDNNILIGMNADVPSGTTSDYISINNVIAGASSALNISGNPTTTTQSPGDNSTKIATTAYVDAAVAAGGSAATTFQYLTSGSSATYTRPSGCTAIRIRGWAGGGGGAAESTNGGSAGGDTIFNSVHAAGGSGGAHGGNLVNAGGAGGTGGSGTATMRWPGNAGHASSNSGGFNPGGNGGGTALGGAGLGGPGAGGAGGANTGAGGGGGAATTSGAATGSGGGAGEYFELYIASPSSTYTYTIGAGGSGGAAGGSAGGSGGSGMIIVEEFY